MRVAIIGTGYVGLTTAVALAHIGHQVTCVDVDAGKVDLLRSGGVPIYEPHLATLLTENRQRLTFTTDTCAAVQNNELIMMAVGTPSRADGSADLSYLDSALSSVGEGLRSSSGVRIVVNKSTAPVGTGRRIMEKLSQLVPEAGVMYASNPEFLRQGSAVFDSLFPDRIVVGSQHCAAFETLHNLYRPLIERSFPVVEGMSHPSSKPLPLFLRMDTNSAELAKYASNCFLAMKVSFINEMANLAEVLGADIGAVANVMASDPRIGAQHLRPGIGYGGSCFPKDTKALLHMGAQTGYETQILRAVIDVNEVQWRWVPNTLEAHLGSLAGKCIVLLGLAFKPGTDDLRDAPSLQIARALHQAGAVVRAHDPVAGAAAHALSPWLDVFGDPHEALSGADAAAIVTEWPIYGQLDWSRIEGSKPRLLLDGRRLLVSGDIAGVEVVTLGSGQQKG